MPVIVQKRPSRISEKNILVKSSMAKPPTDRRAQKLGLIYKANLKVLADAADKINKKRDENK